MKKLDEIAFDFARCCNQAEELRAWLAANDELTERGDVLPFFRARPQLAVLFGMFNSRIAWADRIAWEFDVFGDFACDLLVGEWERGEYCLVEFENAKNDSIFVKEGKKATREWGRRFDHGYSQIIDWTHKLDSLSRSPDFLARFGRYEINYEAAFVIGRDKHLNEGEKQRLRWCTDKVAVNNKKITCVTFDELLSQFSTRLRALSAAASTSEPKTAGPALSPPPSASE